MQDDTETSVKSGTSAPTIESTVSQNSIAVSGLSVAARLPQFWRERQSLWFAQLEAILSASKANDDTKYQYVIANLDRRDLEQISDILLSPPTTNKYGKVKERLIQVYEENEEQRLQRLIEGLDLGDALPSTSKAHSGPVRNFRHTRHNNQSHVGFSFANPRASHTFICCRRPRFTG